MPTGRSVIPQVSAVRPLLALPGGRVTVEGGPFRCDLSGVPSVRIGDRRARVVFAAPDRISVIVPDGVEGRVPLRLEDVPGGTALLDVGEVIATGIHQVDNPVVDRDGTAFLTCSGSRGQQTPVSVYRVRRGGPREVFATGITNATSLAIGPDGRLYVSSRFDGSVSRFDDAGRSEVVAGDLGIACGLAFAPDGSLYVGDRSGTIFKMNDTGETRTLASLPPSIAAYHLAAAPDGALFVTGPTLGPCDHVYRIVEGHAPQVFATGFGRPQGLAFDDRGQLFVVDALAGAAGLYRVYQGMARDLVLSAPRLVGLTFESGGALTVASNDTAWRFAAMPRG